MAVDGFVLFQYHCEMRIEIAKKDSLGGFTQPLTDIAVSQPLGRAEQGGRQLDLGIAVAGLLALIALPILGTYFAFAFILSTLSLVVCRPIDSAHRLIRFLPLLLLPLLALASTAWSDAPERTARAALELLATVAAAIIIANRLSARAVLLTMFWGVLCICVIALAYVPASLSSGLPLAGPFASKNPMGFTAQLLLALSLVVTADKQQPSIARLLAVPSFLLAVFLIFISNSGNATAGAALMLLIIPAFLLFGRCNFYVRISISLVVLLVVALALVFLPDIMAMIADFRQNVLQKDATLTGRTHLWEIAFQLAAERPLLGHGYAAFWRHGNVEAEALWRWGGIASRAGFNFHNAFVEMLVELGWIGSGLLVATCAGIAIAGIYALIVRPTPAMAFLLAFIFVLYIRSYTENGLVSPFSLVTFVWVATGVYAMTGSGAFAAVDGESKRGVRQGRSLVMEARKT